MKNTGAASGFGNAWPLGTDKEGKCPLVTRGGMSTAELDWRFMHKKIEHPTVNFDSWPWTENIFFHFN